MDDQEKKSQALDKMKKEVSEAMDQTQVEEALTNNEVEFEYQGKVYRVRKPTFKEKQEVNRKRVKKYTELLSDDDYTLESSLKAMYKKRGVDIDGMDQKMIQLEQKKKEISLKLGKAIKDGRSDTELKNYRDEIIECTTKQTIISVEKVSYLQYSIETQVNIYVYAYLSYIVSEKKMEDNKWVKAYSNYEEFENADGPLTTKFVMLASYMIQHEMSVN